MTKEKEDQQKELEDLKKSLKEKDEELQNQAKEDKATPTVQIFIDKLKEKLQECEATNEEQDKQFQKLLGQKKHLFTEAEEYGKQIVTYGYNMDALEKEKAELQKNKTDMELERDHALKAIEEQNQAVQEIVMQERKTKQELQQATHQIQTLKTMHLHNIEIQKKQTAEAEGLKKQLQACEEKMQQLGIEADKQNLEDAIKLSETAKAAEALAETTEASAKAAATTPAPPAPTPPASAKAELPVKASPKTASSTAPAVKAFAPKAMPGSTSTPSTTERGGDDMDVVSEPDNMD